MTQLEDERASVQLIDQQGRPVQLMDSIMKKVQNRDVRATVGGRKEIPHDSAPFLRRAYLMQVVMVLAANCSILSAGMGLGFPAITMAALRNPDEGVPLTDSQTSWFASINTFVCPLGGVLCSFILDRLGRKITLMLVNVISITSWGIMAFASKSDPDVMYTQLLVARILIGINIGLSSMPATVYAAEISSPKIRGRLISITSVFISLGVLIIYLLGYCIPQNWRLVSGIATGICVVSFMLLIPVPETPSWLVSKGRERRAEKSLKLFRGVQGDTQRQDIDQELQELVMQVSADRNNRGKRESTIELLRQPDVYKPLLLMIAFFFFQQTSGIFVLIVYAKDISEEAKVPLDTKLCTVIIGAVRVFANLLVIAILDKFGRKPPTILSGIGMAVCMYGLAAHNFFKLEVLEWLPSAFLFAYIVSSTIGFHSIPFAMNAEIFPRKARGLACGLTVGCGYFIAFCVIKLYPLMQSSMSNVAIFSIYGSFAVLGVLFVKFLLIETKGKSLTEIEEHFRGKRSESDPLSMKTISFISKS